MEDTNVEREVLEGFSDAISTMLSVNCEHNDLEPRVAIMATCAGLAKFICEVAHDGKRGDSLRGVGKMIAERFELIADRCEAYEAASPDERARMDAEIELQMSAPAGHA